LVLQGGGALGSYQAGVYEALSSSGYTPDWVAGISIGAINAAIIAGNAPNDRVHRLRSFWEAITAPTMLWPNATGALATWQRWTGAVTAVAFGQPGFFSPNQQTWYPSELVSYYSTKALKATLERLVDFDRINTWWTIFRATVALSSKSTSFQRARHRPTNLDEVHEREKDIRYSSRTRLATNVLRERHDVRHAINELYKLLPPEIARTPQAKRLLDHGCITTMDIIQLIYRPDEQQGSLKDFEFSRPTMELRWQQGFADARTTFRASPWLAPMPSELGVRVFDVIHDVLTKNEAIAGQQPLLRSHPDAMTAE
jgi:hypothetical protein